MKKKNKKTGPIGHQCYKSLKGNKYTKITKTKEQIDKHYENIVCKDELLKCYKKLSVINFLDKSVFFTVQLSTVTFGIGFLFEKFCNIYESKSAEISSITDNSIVAFICTIFILLIFAIMLLIIIFQGAKGIIRNFQSDYQMFILPYEKSVIEKKLCEDENLRAILDSMK